MDKWRLACAQAFLATGGASRVSPAFRSSIRLLFTSDLGTASLGSLGLKCVLNPLPSCGRQLSAIHLVIDQQTHLHISKYHVGIFTFEYSANLDYKLNLFCVVEYEYSYT